MRRARRRVVDLAVSAVLLAVPLAFLHASFRAGQLGSGAVDGRPPPARLNAFDRAVLAVAAPLQRGASWVVEGVGSAVSDYVWLVDVAEENAELRRENERLRARLEDALRKARAADDLEGLLELRGKSEYPTLAARVVAVGTSPYFRVTRIAIDRGEADVAPGMAVVAPDGIVGRIQRVYGHYADVALAVDPQSVVDVVLPRTGSRGVLRGVGAENAYSCRISYLLRSEELQPDDLVVTSGLGGVFPRDVPVGRVRRIEKSEYGMYQEVEIAPAVDFSHLRAVTVVLTPPPPPDPSLGKGTTRKSPEPAFGLVPGP